MTAADGEGDVKRKIFLVGEPKAPAFDLAQPLKDLGYAVELAPDDPRGFDWNAEGIDAVVASAHALTAGAPWQQRIVNPHATVPGGEIPVLLSIDGVLDEEEALVAAARWGADDVLVEPYPLSDLSERLGRLLASEAANADGYPDALDAEPLSEWTRDPEGPAGFREEIRRRAQVANHSQGALSLVVFAFVDEQAGVPTESVDVKPELAGCRREIRRRLAHHELFCRVGPGLWAAVLSRTAPAAALERAETISHLCTTRLSGTDAGHIFVCAGVATSSSDRPESGDELLRSAMASAEAAFESGAPVAAAAPVVEIDLE